ncbi:MAG: TetR/AcrR family transcriptional regulator [Rhodoglobus sp.]
MLKNPSDRNSPSPASAHVDPRIQRTREHVLRVTRDLLEERKGPLTLSALADRAKVTRQTLYTHWGTIDNVVADTIVLARPRNRSHYEALDSRSRAELFLNELVDTLDPAMSGAIASIIGALQYDEAAGSSFGKVDDDLFTEFIAVVGPITHDQFVELTGPIVISIIAGGTASRELVLSLAERAAQFLN